MSSDRRVEMSQAFTGVADIPLITSALDAVRVIVVVPDHASPDVVAAASGLVSMAARVFGRVEVGGAGALPPNPWHVATFDDLATIFPGCAPADTHNDIVVVFGEAASGDWYVGGDDWTAVVSRSPQRVARCNLGGLGLHAAAALVFGELLKSVLGSMVMRCVTIGDTLVWNLVDGRLASSPEVGAPQNSGPVALAGFGAGSLGSSAFGILGMTPVTGRATIVDPDHFDPIRNTYRYPALTPTTAGPKATWAATVLEASGWATEGFVGTVADWVASRPEPGFDGIAVVSVDRVDGRRDAADLLARVTVSAGVSGLKLHAHRSVAGDHMACSYCEYVDVAPPMTQLDVYEDLTGISPSRLAQLLGGERLSSADVHAAVAARKISESAADRLIGGRLEDLLHRRYAQAEVKAGGLVADVSAPHVSWFGGVLLAAEVVKAAAGLPPLDRRVEIDLAGVPLGGWRRPARDRSGRCICASPARRTFAERLYAA